MLKKIDMKKLAQMTKGKAEPKGATPTANGSSLAGRTREMQEEAMTQQANVGSIRDEMVRAQSMAKDLEGRVAELVAKKQHAVEELRRVKEKNDTDLERL